MPDLKEIFLGLGTPHLKVTLGTPNLRSVPGLTQVPLGPLRFQAQSGKARTFPQLFVHVTLSGFHLQIAIVSQLYPPLSLFPHPPSPRWVTEVVRGNNY